MREFIMYQDPSEPKPGPVTLGDTSTYPKPDSAYARAIVSSLKRENREDRAWIRYHVWIRHAAIAPSEKVEMSKAIRSRIRMIRNRDRYIAELTTDTRS